MYTTLLRMASLSSRRILLFLLFFISITAGARNFYFTTTGNWTASANWNGGYPGITVNAGDSVFINASCTVPVGTGLSINGVLVINSSAGLTNSGSITFSRTLVNNSSAIINNYGTLTWLKGNFINSGSFYNLAGGVMSVKCAITNNGLLNNAGNLNIVGVNGGNTGIITNTSTGAIVNSQNLSIIGAVFNEGAITNTSTGVISDSIIFQHETGATFNNDGTVLVFKYASFFFHGSPVATSGGTIINRGNFVIDDAVFTNNGTIQNIYQVNNNGTFINNGEINSQYSISNLSSGNMTNNGTISLSPSNLTYLSTLSQSNVFTNAATGIINIPANTRLSNADTLYNMGAINLPDATSLLVNNPKGKSFSNTIFNTGTISNLGIIKNGSSLKDQANSTFTNQGQVFNTGYFEENGTFTNSGLFENDSMLVVAGGTLSNNSSGSFQNRHNGQVTISGIMNNSGTMLLTDTTRLTVQGTLNNYYKLSLLDRSMFINHGTVNHSTSNQSTPASIDNGASFSNSSTFNCNAPFNNRLFFWNDGIVNASGLFTNALLFTNYGTFNINSFGIFYNNATVTNGAAFNNNNLLSISGTFTNAAGGTLLNNTSMDSIVITATGKLVNETGGNVVIVKAAGGDAKITAFRPPPPPGAQYNLYNFGNITNSGSFANNRNVDNKNIFNSTGTVSNNTAAAFVNEGNYSSGGVLTNSGLLLLLANTFINTGTLQNNNNILITSPGTMNNTTGTILNAQSFEASGMLVNSSADKLVNYFSASLQGYTGTYMNYAITGQPVSETAPAGSVAGFSVANTGTPVTWQWQLSIDAGASWNNISDGTIYRGTTTASLNVDNVQSSYNGYQYRCLLSGPQAGNSALSQAATLTVTN